jgi:hypothetical protein
MSFQGLSNGTTLMQIQSGRTVPLIYFICSGQEFWRTFLVSVLYMVFPPIMVLAGNHINFH